MGILSHTGNLQFGIAAEVLAFIDNPMERNALYEQIVKPLGPIRPELVEIKKLLESMGKGLGEILDDEKIKKLVKKAEWDKDPELLIEQLRLRLNDPLAKQRKEFNAKVDQIREKAFSGYENVPRFLQTETVEAWKALLVEKFRDLNLDMKRYESGELDTKALAFN